MSIEKPQPSIPFLLIRPDRGMQRMGNRNGLDLLKVQQPVDQRFIRWRENDLDPTFPQHDPIQNLKFWHTNHDLLFLVFRTGLIGQKGKRTQNGLRVLIHNPDDPIRLHHPATLKNLFDILGIDPHAVTEEFRSKFEPINRRRASRIDRIFPLRGDNRLILIEQPDPGLLQFGMEFGKHGGETGQRKAHLIMFQHSVKKLWPPQGIGNGIQQRFFRPIVQDKTPVALVNHQPPTGLQRRCGKTLEDLFGLPFNFEWAEFVLGDTGFHHFPGIRCLVETQQLKKRVIQERASLLGLQPTGNRFGSFQKWENPENGQAGPPPTFTKPTFGAKHAGPEIQYRGIHRNRLWYESETVLISRPI